MSEMSLLLYDHPVSSYAQKVRIVLREKGLSFERASPLALDGQSGPAPEFLKANPRGEIPVLIVSNNGEMNSTDRHAVVDSRVICEFLEDSFPAKRLLPESALQRAKARHIEQVLDTQYEAVNWGYGEIDWMNRAEGTLAEHIKSEAERQTRVLQKWLEDRIESSGWLTGSHFGLADAAAAPIVHRSAYFGFAPDPGSKLDHWLQKVRQWPSVAATLKEFDDNVESMRGLAPIFQSGKRKREYRDYRLEFLVKSGGMSIVTNGLERENIRFPWPEGRSA